MYTVYKILNPNNGKVLYIGRTKDLKRREYQHNYNLRKGVENDFYNFSRDEGIELKLIPIRGFDRKVEAKRFECFLILKDYFRNGSGNRELLNKVPNISDR